MSKVIYSALFGNYEEIKQPKIITPGWTYLLYTDQDIKSNIWDVIKLGEPEDKTMASRLIKIKGFSNWKQSIWIDASFIINTDLNQWWERHFKKGFSAAKHPLRNCVYQEGMDCILSKRGNRLDIERQLNVYKSEKVPNKSGIITSGLLMRENTPDVIELCEKWWEEVEKYSSRDQIGFGKVFINSECVHTYDWDYRREKDFIYMFHYNRRGNSFRIPGELPTHSKADGMGH